MVQRTQMFVNVCSIFDLIHTFWADEVLQCTLKFENGQNCAHDKSPFSI